MTHLAIALASLVIVAADAAYIDPQTITNPTGTYRLSVRRSQRRGEMRVTLCDPSHIAIRLVVSSGAPAFDAGSLVDTLDYANNTAVYVNPDDGTTCRLVFLFSRSAMQIGEERAGGCSFGNGVTVAGYYRRVNRRARTF